MGGSVVAGLSARLEMATAAAEHHQGSGAHVTSRGQMAGSGGRSAGFEWYALKMPESVRIFLSAHAFGAARAPEAMISRVQEDNGSDLA